MIINNETELLSLFINKDNRDPRFQEPFMNINYDGEIWATDAHSLLIVNKKCLGGIYIYRENKLRLPELGSENCNTIITQDALRLALKECPQEDEEISTGQYRHCEECDGTGMVEWEYQDSKGDTHTQDFDCPLCYGTGESNKPVMKKTGRKIPDKDSVLIVDTMPVASYEMLRLLKAMELLGIEEVRHTITAKEKPNLFVFNDDIKIIIMPRYLRDFEISAKVICETKKGGEE